MVIGVVSRNKIQESAAYQLGYSRVMEGYPYDSGYQSWEREWIDAYFMGKEDAYGDLQLRETLDIIYP